MGAMEALRIVSVSWPLAVMFIAVVVASVAFYVIRWMKKSDLDDKALRASQAVTVRQRDDQ